MEIQNFVFNNLKLLLILEFCIFMWPISKNCKGDDEKKIMHYMTQLLVSNGSSDQNFTLII